jgi:secreted Zn-dependent insulinase-like peptidase
MISNYFAPQGNVNNPTSHFFTGNSETLAELPKKENWDIIKALKKFHSL